MVHCLLYVPTLSIANSIAFANIKDPQKEFGVDSHGRHDRVDSGGLAVHFHLRGLGQGA